MSPLKKICGLFFCSLLSIICKAQTVKGTVKDSTDTALPYATVSLKNGITNAIISYTITDSRGSFVLKLPENISVVNFSIEARALGYTTVIRKLTGVDLPVAFVLSPTANLLQDVVVTSSRPVLRSSGDTLSYAVSAFANPQDRTIGEVIKKMPGITIGADGTIRYNNKPVSTVYIDGDNLLDDQYSIATNNIPQGVVNHVQVIENNQPIKALQNKVLSNEVALNLQFRKGAKIHLIGQESIAAGMPGNYDLNLNAMMFRNNYKAINYLSGNNTGNNVQRDLVPHNLNDNQQRIDNAIPAAMLSLGAVNNPDLIESRYLFNQSGILNLNNLINLKKNIQLKVNGYYVHDRQRQEYSQQTLIYLPGDTVRYSEAQHNRSIPNIFHTQLTLNINRDRYYLNNVFTMDHSNLENYSGLQTDSAMLNQLWHDQLHSFSNELSLIKTFKSNHLIRLYSYISHSSEPEKLAIDPGYNAVIFNNNQSYAGLAQNVNLPGWYANHYLSFGKVSGLITQNYRAGFSLLSQKLESHLDIVRNDHTIRPQSDSTINHISWEKQKFYAEAAYDLPGTIIKAKLVLPVTIQMISHSDSSQTNTINLTRFYFNPQLDLQYKTGAENYFSFQYALRDRIGTIENIYPGYILTDYRTLQTGNTLLTERKINEAGLGFNYRKAIKLFFWNISALYNHTSANNIASSVVTENIRKGVVLPYPNSNESWILSGSVSKYIFPLRTTFTGSLQWQKTRSVLIQNGVLLFFNTVSQTISLNADTKVSDRINFSYKATLLQTKSRSQTGISEHQVNQLLQQANINYDPANNIQFKLSGEYYLTGQTGNPGLKYFFADASLKFKLKKWKTDVECSAVNFLNIKTYNALYLSANTFTASSYTLPGRIAMIKFFFNL